MSSRCITILKETKYEVGRHALEEERRILHKFKEYRVSEPGFLISGGTTELFTKDVLELDS